MASALGVREAATSETNELPEELQELAIEMVMLLRHDQWRRGKCNAEGWVPIADLLAELTSGNRARLGGKTPMVTERNVLQVAEFSRCAAARRFEARRFGTEWRLRAASWSPSLLEGCFDGAWRPDGMDSDTVCIKGNKLKWFGASGILCREEIVAFEGDFIVVSFEGDTPTRGKIGDGGNSIRFEDTDVWWRLESNPQPEDTWPPEEWRHPEKHGEALDRSLSDCTRLNAAQDNGIKNGGIKNDGIKIDSAPEWREHRAKSDWDSTSSGSGYLSLQKGETVFVLPKLEEGWAYGWSSCRMEQGWFPPSYTTPVDDDEPLEPCL